VHGHPFEHFVGPIEQTARFCGMRWQAPFVVHGSHRLSPEALNEQAVLLREQVSQAWQREVGEVQRG